MSDHWENFWKEQIHQCYCDYDYKNYGEWNPHSAPIALELDQCEECGIYFRNFIHTKGFVPKKVCHDCYERILNS